MVNQFNFTLPRFRLSTWAIKTTKVIGYPIAENWIIASLKTLVYYEVLVVNAPGGWDPHVYVK